MRNLLILTALFGMAGIQPTTPLSAQTQTALSPSTALYARAVRLRHNPDASKNGNVIVSVTAFPNGNGEEDIYSSNDGTSFSLRGSITAPEFVGGLCCGTLFELPSKVGQLLPGTLLWAGSVGQNSSTAPMKLEVFASIDQGAHWSYLSNCATAAKPHNVGGGLWEPEFEIANGGALVCFYSDETQPSHSQLLAKVRTYDGLNWQDNGFAVATNVPQDRPGMAVVTHLPSGTYFMTFELCGPAACGVYYKTSSDGWNWGDPTNVGSRIQTASGQYFEHAPVNIWTPASVSPSGAILLVGQVLYESNGTVSSGNGKTIFTNTSQDGPGTWNAIAAPVQVLDAYDNYCPNYSSSLLPSLDGSTLLEFASDYSGSTCQMNYATAPLAVHLSLAATSTALTVTPSSVNVAGSVMLTATVTSPSGPPSGMVNFTLGSTSLGTSTLSTANGTTTAMLTVPSASSDSGFQPGANTLSASYQGNSAYAASHGTAILTITKPAFTLAAETITLSSSTPGTTGTSTISLTSLNGYSGTVRLAASSTDWNGLSTVAPTTVALSSGGTSVATLTVSTPSSVSQNADPNAFFLFTFAAPLGFFSFAKRGLPKFYLLLLLMAPSLPALAGCSSNTAHQKPPLSGTYHLTITGTDSQDSTIVANANVTVSVP